MKGLAASSDKNKLTISILKQFYEREAVFAAAHSVSAKCFVSFDAPDDKCVEVVFTLKEPTSEDMDLLEQTARLFMNDLLDQQVRLDLEKRYGNIREMIVKQAFAPISLNELAQQLKNNKHE